MKRLILIPLVALVAAHTSAQVITGNTLYGWGFSINTDGAGDAELAGFPDGYSFGDWYREFEVSRVLQQSVIGLSSLNRSNVTDQIQNDGTNQTLNMNPTGAGRFYRLMRL